MVVDTMWLYLIDGAYCNYNNDSANGNVYGHLYNWYALNDSRALAPEGWHIPSDTEWQTLVDYLGGSAAAGGKMKEAGTIHWNVPNTDASNESGFTALPGGTRWSGGSYHDLGNGALFWSLSESSSSYAWDRYMNYTNSIVDRDTNDKRFGFSVRCVKD